MAVKSSNLHSGKTQEVLFSAPQIRNIKLKMKLEIIPVSQILIWTCKAHKTSLGTTELLLKQIKDVAFSEEKLPIGVL